VVVCFEAGREEVLCWYYLKNSLSVTLMLMSKKVQFARNLVKGKIAETVFAQMLRETGEFTVLEFGYEKIIPDLVGQGYEENGGLVETLRTAPDFAVINHSTREVRLIEVKYMHTIDASYVLRYAERMHKSWNPSYLFIATLDGFYFGEITKIIENNGAIKPLEHPQVSMELQQNYIKILQDFESNN
jgi:hypothetical protein